MNLLKYSIYPLPYILLTSISEYERFNTLVQGMPGFNSNNEVFDIRKKMYKRVKVKQKENFEAYKISNLGMYIFADSYEGNDALIKKTISEIDVIISNDSYLVKKVAKIRSILCEEYYEQDYINNTYWRDWRDWRDLREEAMKAVLDSKKACEASVDLPS
ncbi:hypothetical protein JCM17380_16750 [Desulfosporosinus burensis]